MSETTLTDDAAFLAACERSLDLAEGRTRDKASAMAMMATVEFAINGRRLVALARKALSAAPAPEPVNSVRESVLADRIDRAIAALDQAPDVAEHGASKREAAAIARANVAAWVILSEGRYPPPQRPGPP